MSDWRKYVDLDNLKKAIEILKPDNELFEIRICPPDRRRALSGYFKTVEKLIQAFDKVDLANTNIYITLNKLKEACYSRQQRDTFRAGANTTADSDIDRREWLFIDLDPIRATGVSSTKEEKQAAAEMAKNVKDYLNGLGFSEPIGADSGNGYHLLYRIDMPNDKESHKIIESCLKVLATLFNNDQVKIDTVNANASRICKLYGTLAQKGSWTKERPHRQSFIFASNYGVTDVQYLKKLAAELREPERTFSRQTEDFDLLPWMDKNGLKIFRESEGDDCTIYALEECPFDHSHQHGDSKIFHYRNGAIAFKCHHNSCQQYKWQDVRKLFEPDAYEHIDDGHIDDGYKRYKANREKMADADYVELSGEEELNQEPMFYTADMVIQMPEQAEEFILSGCTEIDSKLRGLKKGAISVLSGCRSSAKSTWLNQVVLTAVQNNETVVMYSGELDKKTVFKWLFLQAAGDKNREGDKPGYYYTPKDIQAKISKWIGQRLFLYNNRYGNNFTAMKNILLKKIRDNKADLVILDNLMTLDIREMNPSDKYAAQSAFVQSLKRIAMQTNTHIIFVAHPRKTTGFLRLEDIAGSGDIVNAVDNAFIIHRRNKDFEDRYKEFSKYSLVPCDNVIEICKDRENGTQDYFIPLWYDSRSKRLKNEDDEHIIYGWEDVKQDGFISFPDEIANPFEEVDYGE